MFNLHTETLKGRKNDQGNQEPHQHQDQNEYRLSNEHSNNNIIRAHGAGRVLISPEDGEKIREAYAESIGPMTGPVARLIEETMESTGATVDEIVWAIEQTGFAPRPTPAYLRAILRNWQQAGRASTCPPWQTDAAQAAPWWKAPARKNPALDYAQREYTAEWWDEWQKQAFEDVMAQDGGKD